MVFACTLVHYLLSPFLADSHLFDGMMFSLFMSPNTLISPPATLELTPGTAGQIVAGECLFSSSCSWSVFLNVIFIGLS